MDQLIINSYEEFAAYEGKQLGASEWLLVDQDRINSFADATLDHQWIHVDTARAAEESPYKSTIAHGYLTLSLLPHMWNEIIKVNNLKMMVNYGMDKMRFGVPVITGSKIRLVASLEHIENLRERLQHIRHHGPGRGGVRPAPATATTPSRARRAVT